MSDTKSAVSISFGVGSFIISIAVYFLAIVFWGEANTTFGLVFAFKPLYYSSPIACFAMSFLWTRVFLSEAIINGPTLGNVTVMGLKICVMSFFSLAMILALQAFFVSETIIDALVLFGSLFFLVTVFGGIYFGWIVIIGALGVSYVSWRMLIIKAN